MYRQRYNNSYQRNNNAPRFGRSTGRGKREVKSFNPIDLISQANNVQQKPQAAPFTPVHTFSDFPISDQLKNNIAARGFTQPTPIQDQVIPHLLAGRDVIGIANTGTGKTAAFLIPLIEKIVKNRNGKVLIVAPTRELAVQIRDDLFALARGLQIYSVLCIGGTNMFRQRNDLRRPYNFVIGTPGRLKDLIQDKSLAIGAFQTVVLDETDRMVDIGFLPDIKFIVSFLPKNRHSLFFSATVDGRVREILHSFVQNPVTVSVKTQETAEGIEQNIIKVLNKHAKIDLLHDLLIKEDFSKVLIFGRTKWGVQKLSDELVKRGFKADAIHGNKRQNQRQRTLDRFKRSEIQILLATGM